MSATWGASWRGTTRGLPIGRDYEYFCDAVCDLYVGVRPDRPVDAFIADFAVHDLGETRLGFLSTPGVAAARDRSSLAQFPDDAVFVNFSRAPWTLDHLGKSWAVPAGTPLILDNAELFRLSVDPARRLQLYSLRIPRASLGEVTPGDIRALDERLPSTPAGGHVAAQTRLLAAMIDTERLDVAATMAAALIGLLGAVADSDGVPGEDRLAGYKTWASLRIADSAFGIARLAREFRCSERTIQSAFAMRGETFSEWLAAERLEVARSRLGDPAWATWNVARIAASVGFADLSTFHRGFRRRFGVSPGSTR